MKRLIFAALLLTFASGAWAESIPQVIWCNGNHTLYFTYAEPVTQGSPYGEQTADRIYSGDDFNYAKWGNNSDITGNCTTVVFETSFSSARPTKCTYWFLSLGALTNIQGIDNLNTSEVTNMGSMFAGCVGLASLDLSHFNTASVTDMESMFKNCIKLTTLDLSSFDTSNVTTMSEMFSGCSALTTLTVASGWTKIANRANRFSNCTPSTIHLVMDDNGDNPSLLKEFGDFTNGKNVNVTLRNRTLQKDGNWNTLCLPFDLDLASGSLAGDNIVAKVFDATSSLSDAGELTLKFTDATTIPAGTPFIIKWDNTGQNQVNPVFTGVTISNTAAQEVTSTDAKVKFVGKYTPFAITNENINEILYVASGNKIGYSAGPRTLRSFRAHLWVKPNGTAQAARYIYIDFGDSETTSLSDELRVKSEEFATAQWYSLDGRKLAGQPTQKGMYIVNGKKVIIK